ncbi:uncharacterized protein LOC133731252 [Rosa rugosa]|uniref:uncharacterized protein LOC133731252 n=1 Tax=Rosa rugosa TaxID=74645 RepID=UPI002B402FD9|nr:uncharacterized protein LOC133731252 [Rosa rugosa]
MVWFGSPLGIRIDKQKISKFDKWLQEIHSSSSTAADRKWLLTLISFFCWKIWTARCEFIYQMKPILPQSIILSGSNLASEFGEAKRWIASRLPLPNHSHSSKWIPPPPGIVKINVDAAWSDASKACGLGVVLRDHPGAVVGGSIRSDMCGSALVAEAKAILDGVNYALQHDITKVIVESDALEVVSEIQSKRKNKNWMTYPLIEEIRRKSLRFSEIS